MTLETTQDAYLGGNLSITQPKAGYRAGTDPVLLAAACPAQAQETVLDIGCGVGVAALCLARRVEGVALSGLEVNPEIADLARKNARENKLDFEVVTGDLFAPDAQVKAFNVDHVISNPPFFDTAKVTVPSRDQKAQSFAMATSIDEWVIQCLKRVKPKGYLTMINRVEALPGMLAGLQGVAGHVRILPLAARRDHSAKRVIVIARKNSNAAPELLPPFVLHAGEHHHEGAGYSKKAEAVLRDGAGLAELGLL